MALKLKLKILDVIAGYGAFHSATDDRLKYVTANLVFLN